MKQILPALFIVSAFLSCSPKVKEGISSGEKSCIQIILSEDEKLGKIRNHGSETKEINLVIKEYVQALEILDFKNCPTEFTNAFKAHIDAWKEIIPVASHYGDERSEMHVIFDMIESGPHQKEFKKRLNKIWSTWYEVERTSKNQSQ